MRILLVRTKGKNIFAALNTICFEPLELEYLGAKVKELNFDYRIYDGLIEKKDFIDFLSWYKPHVVAITGYSIHVNDIKDYANRVKRYDDKIKVLVGGVHAELNWEDLYIPSIDVVIHSNPVEAFGKVLLALEQGRILHDLKNICVYQNGTWVKKSGEMLNPNELHFPDRAHLKVHKNKFRYFGKEQCAMVKTSWGCNYNCTFCYCGCLNEGKYATRDLDKVVDEIKTIDQKKIFIIDDNFLVDKKRVVEFYTLIKSHQINKKFSVYGRSDFICTHEEILPILKEAGIQEIIVGLETVDDDVLKNYQKQVKGEQNFRCIELLRKYGIESCGLFIVDQHYGIADFKKLAQTVKKMKLDLCMFSIFTPLKGVPQYAEYQDKLIISEDQYKYLDFLHLIIKPTKLKIWRFYYEFYKLYLVSYLDIQRLKNNFIPLIKSLINLAGGK